jgi:hypothetical protein
MAMTERLELLIEFASELLHRALCGVLGHRYSTIRSYFDDSAGDRYELTSKTYCLRCLRDKDDIEDICA